MTTQHVFTQNWLNHYYSRLVSLVFERRTSSVWWKFLKWNVQGSASSRNLLRPHCWLCSACYVRIAVYPFFSHDCCCWCACLLNLCLVFVYTWPLVTFAFVAFSISICFTLMIFILAAFVYCFHVKWYYVVLVVVAFTKKKERQRQQAKQTYHLILSIVVFISESYLFCDSCKSWISMRYDVYFKLWIRVVWVWY